MSPELTALALVRQILEAPGTITDSLLMEAAMGAADPLQHQLDITRSLIRIIGALLNIAGGTNERALIILSSIEAEYQTEGHS
ncbi:hypothetical protein [Pseudarthrobacter sp. CCNWLW207]|uniref:hypothetical protein n=1 Tax=Pseudarthrobacter sp. CCNWLW207 TaxID=3127468 RepID=UPI003078476B